MKWLFVNDFSLMDTLFMSVASHGLASGDIIEPIVITVIGLTVKYTIGRKYNAPSVPETE